MLGMSTVIQMILKQLMVTNSVPSHVVGVMAESFIKVYDELYWP